MRIEYYIDTANNNPVKQFIDSLDHKQKAKILRILFIIQEYGLTLAIPHLKKLHNLPLWEIRLLGKDNIRIIYITIYSASRLLLLHGFHKRKNKTPQWEIEISMDRYKNLIKRIDY